MNKNYVHSNSKPLWKIFFKIEKSFEEKRYKIIYGMEKYDFFLNIWLNKRFFSLKRCFPCSYRKRKLDLESDIIKSGLKKVILIDKVVLQNQVTTI